MSWEQLLNKRGGKQVRGIHRKNSSGQDGCWSGGELRCRAGGGVVGPLLRQSAGLFALLDGEILQAIHVG